MAFLKSCLKIDTFQKMVGNSFIPFVIKWLKHAKPPTWSCKWHQMPVQTEYFFFFFFFIIINCHALEHTQLELEHTHMHTQKAISPPLVLPRGIISKLCYYFSPLWLGSINMVRWPLSTLRLIAVSCAGDKLLFGPHVRRKLKVPV